jgi:hypothetical protein
MGHSKFWNLPVVVVNGFVLALGVHLALMLLSAAVACTHHFLGCREIQGILAFLDAKAAA